MSDAIVNARRGLNRALAPATAALQSLGDRPELRIGLLAVVLIAVFLYPFAESSNQRLDAAVEAEVFVLLALGLNIVVGYAGLLDLGYAAFFAIGAYSFAFLGSAHFTITGHSFSSPIFSFGPNGIHVDFFLMIPIAALAAASFGVLFGAPTLRLRGDYLAIVTLGFGEIVPKVIQNLGPGNSLGLPDITGGVNSIPGIDSPPDINFLGVHWTFGGNDSHPWYYLGVLIVIASVIIIMSLRNSRLGRAWAAIREDEVAAAHMGINITRTRLMAFGLGAAFSGFGGLLEASRLHGVDYSQFGFNISITILVMVILGGLGSIPGVIVGAALLSYLNLLWLADVSGWVNSFGGLLQGGPGPIGAVGSWLHQVNLSNASQLIFGVILVSIMLLRPQGIWPSRTRAREMQPQTAEILAEENEELYTAREG
jgi:branched-chain amino acid transport system permease protein